jgi:hypothetical protein
MYECPLCGKTANRKGDTFDSVQKVVGHIDGSHDDAHAGVRGEEFIGDIEAVDVTDDADLGSDSFDADSGDGPPDAGGGGGVAAAATAGGGTETVSAAATEPPEFEQEAEEDLVVMPESELEEMENETASTTSEDTESSSETSAASGGSSSSSDDDGEMESLISTDPVEAGEKAQDSGWSLGAILLWMGVIALAAFAWNVVKKAARQKREQAQNAVTRHAPTVGHDPSNRP